VKLKLDENIPQSAATRLAALGYDVDTVLDEQLGGRSDEHVWAAAQEEGRFLVTHDLDFSDTRKFEPGEHAGVLIVRLPDSEQWRVGDPPRRLVLGRRGANLGALYRDRNLAQGASGGTTATSGRPQRKTRSRPSQLRVSFFVARGRYPSWITTLSVPLEVGVA
jgi:predicted nuclease of predicted toxin-antitoxin system